MDEHFFYPRTSFDTVKIEGEVYNIFRLAGKVNNFVIDISYFEKEEVKVIRHVIISLDNGNNETIDELCRYFKLKKENVNIDELVQTFKLVETEPAILKDVIVFAMIEKDSSLLRLLFENVTTTQSITSFTITRW